MLKVSRIIEKKLKGEAFPICHHHDKSFNTWISIRIRCVVKYGSSIFHVFFLTASQSQSSLIRPVCDIAFKECMEKIFIFEGADLFSYVLYR